MWISTARNPFGEDFCHVIGGNAIGIEVVVKDFLRVQPTGVIRSRQEPGILTAADPINGDVLPGLHPVSHPRIHRNLRGLGRRIIQGANAVGVVDQDRRGASHHIVRVKLGDGQVPAAGCAGCGFGRQDGGVVSLGAGEFIAGLEAVSPGPGTGGAIPEGVIRGGVDGAGVADTVVDGDVEEVGVVINPHVLDSSTTCILPSRRIRGFYLVADLDFAYGLASPVLHEDGSVG